MAAERRSITLELTDYEAAILGVELGQFAEHLRWVAETIDQVADKLEPRAAGE